MADSNLFSPVSRNSQEKTVLRRQQSDLHLRSESKLEENDKKLLRSRRQTYAHQDKNTGEIERIVVLAYVLPAIAAQPVTFLLNVYGISYYQSLGLSFGTTWLIAILASTLEFMFTLFAGYLSDRARFINGRRKPFILIGGIFYILFLMLLCSPPSLTKTQTAFWFGSFYFAFVIAGAFWMIPYFALGIEIAGDSVQRDSVYAWQMVVRNIGILLALVGPPFYSALTSSCHCPQCVDANGIIDISCEQLCLKECGSAPNHSALLLWAGIFCALFLIFLVFVLLKVKERTPSNAPQPNFTPSIKALYKNKPYRHALIPIALETSALFFQLLALPSFVEHVINPFASCIDDGVYLEKVQCFPYFWTGVMIATFIGCSILSVPFWVKFSVKYSKKSAWILSTLLCGFCSLGFIFLGQGDKAGGIVVLGLLGLQCGAFYLQIGAIADCADYDELLTGRRSEGCYVGHSNYITKIVVVSIHIWVVGLGGAQGFKVPVGGKLQEVSDSAITFLKLGFTLLPTALFFLSSFLKRYYPIFSYFTTRATEIEVEKQKISKDLDVSALAKLRPMHPLSGDPFKAFRCNTREEHNMKNAIDHFADMSSIRRLLTIDGWRKLHAKKIVDLVIAVVFMIPFIILINIDYVYLNNPAYSWIPTFSIVILGALIIVFIYRVEKFNTIRNIKRKKTPLDFSFVKNLADYYHKLSEIDTRIPHSRMDIEKYLKVEKMERRSSSHDESSEVDENEAINIRGVEESPIAESRFQRNKY